MRSLCSICGKVIALLLFLVAGAPVSVSSFGPSIIHRSPSQAFLLSPPRGQRQLRPRPWGVVGNDKNGAVMVSGGSSATATILLRRTTGGTALLQQQQQPSSSSSEPFGGRGGGSGIAALRSLLRRLVTLGPVTSRVRGKIGLIKHKRRKVGLAIASALLCFSAQYGRLNGGGSPHQCVVNDDASLSRLVASSSSVITAPEEPEIADPSQGSSVTASSGVISSIPDGDNNQNGQQADVSSAHDVDDVVGGVDENDGAMLTGSSTVTPPAAAAISSPWAKKKPVVMEPPKSQNPPKVVVVLGGTGAATAVGIVGLKRFNEDKKLQNNEKKNKLQNDIQKFIMEPPVAKPLEVIDEVDDEAAETGEEAEEQEAALDISSSSSASTSPPSSGIATAVVVEEQDSIVVDDNNDDDEEEDPASSSSSSSLVVEPPAPKEEAVKAVLNRIHEDERLSASVNEKLETAVAAIEHQPPSSKHHHQKILQQQPTAADAVDDTEANGHREHHHHTRTDQIRDELQEVLQEEDDKEVVAANKNELRKEELKSVVRVEEEDGDGEEDSSTTVVSAAPSVWGGPFDKPLYDASTTSSKTTSPKEAVAVTSEPTNRIGHFSSTSDTTATTSSTSQDFLESLTSTSKLKEEVQRRRAELSTTNIVEEVKVVERKEGVVISDEKAVEEPELAEKEEEPFAPSPSPAVIDKITAVDAVVGEKSAEPQLLAVEEETATEETMVPSTADSTATSSPSVSLVEEVASTILVEEKEEQFAKEEVAAVEEQPEASADDADAEPSFEQPPITATGVASSPSTTAAREESNRSRSWMRGAVGKMKDTNKDDPLAAKYAAIDDVGDRAYQILLDLGMVGSEEEEG